MRKKLFFLVLAITFSTCIYTPCLASDAKMIYGFKYWKYYNDGIEAQEAGNYTKAIKMYQLAIKTDPEKGRARRARTYGMHFVDNYDPEAKIEECLKVLLLIISGMQP